MNSKKSAPVSNGVYLNESECDRAFKEIKLLKELSSNLERVAEYHGIEFKWLRNWPDRHGLARILEGGKRVIKLPHSTALGERIGFYHELHHLIFAPEVIAFKQCTREEIARWEGKADSFAALIAMPLLPDGNDGELNEIEIYRLFGPYHKVNAHYRIQHAKKHGH